MIIICRRVESGRAGGRAVRVSNNIAAKFAFSITVRPLHCVMYVVNGINIFPDGL